MMTGGMWLPESPRWLVMNNRFDEALVSLKRVRGGSPSDAAYELSILRKEHPVRSVSLLKFTFDW